MIDAWILSKLQHLVEEVTKTFLMYEYSKARQQTDTFFWQTFCDNYLEIVKDRVYNKNNYKKEEVLSAHYTLYHASLTLIKLFAPIMPHITEEVYHFMYDALEGVPSIHRTAWPEVNKGLLNTRAEEAGDLFVAILATVRKYKSEQQVSLKTPLKVLRISCERNQKELLSLVVQDLSTVTHAIKVEFSAAGTDIPCEGYSIKVGIELGDEEKATSGK